MTLYGRRNYKWLINIKWGSVSVIADIQIKTKVKTFYIYQKIISHQKLTSYNTLFNKYVLCQKVQTDTPLVDILALPSIHSMIQQIYF